MFVTHLSLGHQERKLFPMRKFIKSIMLRPVCEFPFCIISFNKAIFCYIFEEKRQTSYRDFTSFNVPDLMMIKSSFDFCFTNPCFRGVTRRRGRFLEEICMYLMNARIYLGFCFNFWQEILL